MRYPSSLALAGLGLCLLGCEPSADAASHAWTAFRTCAYGGVTGFRPSMDSMSAHEGDWPDTCRTHLREIAEYADATDRAGLGRSARRIDTARLTPEDANPAMREMAHRALWDEVEMAELSDD